MPRWTLENGTWWHYPTKGKRFSGEVRICIRCGDDFVAKKSSKNKFCGGTCSAKAIWEDGKAKATPVQPRPCQTCGTTFKGKRGQRFCTRICMREYNGPEHHLWRGGVYTDKAGYVWVTAPREDPILSKMGYVDGRRVRVMQHRAVMAVYLGRPLTRKETVHHINGDRADNRLENLELWSKSHPLGQNVEDKVAWAKEILGQYGDYVPPSGQKRLN
jgi:hypothetical protein